MSNAYVKLKDLKARDGIAGRRCAERLLTLRKQLAPLRQRRSDSSLLLATWNIRDFDSNKFGFGPRLPESFFYIAEIASCFDLIAVQEVTWDLEPLERLVSILGREWDYIVTDTTIGKSGNDERMAFLFNREKVWFRKVAGEVVLPNGQLIVAQKKVEATVGEATAAKVPEAAVKLKDKGLEEIGQQFARTPFLATFQSGWFRFALCTVHIYYGADTGAKLKRRIAEIRGLVQFFADRQDREVKEGKKTGRAPENYILLGDFNVISPEHETMQALTEMGFVVPDEIAGDKVRKKGAHFYDQIATRVVDKRFKVTGGGMVDLFETVFRDEDQPLYAAHVPAKDPEEGAGAAKTPEALYRKWRTWQMSDHPPLWVEIATDFSDDYLADLAKA